jgi:hypothetical protein
MRTLKVKDSGRIEIRYAGMADCSSAARSDNRHLILEVKFQGTDEAK